MADRPVSIPPVDKLERGELLALVMIVSAGRISDLDIATARWEAANARYHGLVTRITEAVAIYAEAMSRVDTAIAEGRSAKAAIRARDAARAAYVRVDEAATAAFDRSTRRYEDLRRIRAGVEVR